MKLIETLDTCREKEWKLLGRQFKFISGARNRKASRWYLTRREPKGLFPRHQEKIFPRSKPVLYCIVMGPMTLFSTILAFTIALRVWVNHTRIGTRRSTCCFGLASIHAFDSYSVESDWVPKPNTMLPLMHSMILIVAYSKWQMHRSNTYHMHTLGGSIWQGRFEPCSSKLSTRLLCL